MLKPFHLVDQGWAMKAMKVMHMKTGSFEHYKGGYVGG